MLSSQGYLPLQFYSFCHPLLQSWILGKIPSVCGWTKQLHRNSNRNKEDSLCDVMDGPDLCCFFPSVCPSVTNKRICHHSKQNFIAKVSFYSNPLAYRKPAAAITLPSRIPSYPVRRGKLAGWRETAFKAKLSLACLFFSIEQYWGTPALSVQAWALMRALGNPHP